MLFLISVLSLRRTGIPKTACRPIAPLLHPPYQPTRQPNIGPQRLPPPASSITAGIIIVTANVPSYGSMNQPSDGSPAASKYEPQNALLNDKPNESNTVTA